MDNALSTLEGTEKKPIDEMKYLREAAVINPLLETVTSSLKHLSLDETLHLSAAITRGFYYAESGGLSEVNPAAYTYNAFDKSFKEEFAPAWNSSVTARERLLNNNNEVPENIPTIEIMLAHMHETLETLKSLNLPESNIHETIYRFLNAGYTTIDNLMESQMMMVSAGLISPSLRPTILEQAKRQMRKQSPNVWQEYVVFNTRWKWNQYKDIYANQRNFEISLFKKAAGTSPFINRKGKAEFPKPHSNFRKPEDIEFAAKMYKIRTKELDIYDKDSGVHTGNTDFMWHAYFLNSYMETLEIHKRHALGLFIMYPPQQYHLLEKFLVEYDEREFPDEQI